MSQLGSVFRIPFIRVPYYIGIKKDPNLENYPEKHCVKGPKAEAATEGTTRCSEASWGLSKDYTKP